MSSITLLPLGNADRALVHDLSEPLSHLFDAKVEVRELHVDLEQFLDSDRQQYNSSRILLHLANHASHALGGHRGPSRSHKILGIAAEDLFTPILTFVFGEAELRGRAAVVSYHRLANERYGLSPDPALLRVRFVKEAVHELGHVFGLIHCSDQSCVMRASTDVEDIDLKGDVFCAECVRTLRHKR